MSEDEAAVSVVAFLVSLFSWGWWYGCVIRSKRVAASGRTTPRGLLLATPFVAAGLLLLILKCWSAHDVRDDGRYLAMYTGLGLAWCGVASFVPNWLGLSFRLDVLARGNRAAGWVLAGWILAVMLAFAGANVGDGPGWWVVIFSGLLSTGMLAFVFLAWELIARPNDALTIDRDLATGLRTAGLLIGCGAVFGVAAAGNWQDAPTTIRDFCHTAWPAIPIFVMAFVSHQLWRPTPENPRPLTLATGVAPMLVLIAFGLAWAIVVGRHLLGGAA